MPLAQYARTASPRIMTISLPPTRTRRAVYDSRPRKVPPTTSSSTNRFVVSENDSPTQGMRTFWSEDDDNDEVGDSNIQKHHSKPRKPIDCTLDLQPIREATSSQTTSPLTDSPWSSDYPPSTGHRDDTDFTALVACYNNTGSGERQVHDHHPPHKDRVWILSDDDVVSKVERAEYTRIFRSQELLEGTLRANDAAMGKLDWCGAWMAAS
ncbi:MAG: hypothetical protein M1828_001814 [Chrysothrix sp. TS-e1954]|nr:MAG: hypothetical protein M1828_001814 [Chrysothrix sp. TS-e1954]